MLRILSLSLLVACAEPEPAFERADEVASWLERWERVRSCVVSQNGSTISDGAAVAILQGADCAKPLAELTAQVPLDQVATVRWRRIAKSLRDPSANVRAIAVEEGDLESLVLRMSSGIPLVVHPRRALPQLENGPELTADGHRVGYSGISFNGGRIRGNNWGYRFEIYSPVRGRRWIQRSRHMAHPSGRWTGDDVPQGDNTRLAADRDHIRVAVGGVAGAGYSLSVSHDGGRHWARSTLAAGMQLLDFYQDWGTGEIDLLVGIPGREVYRHTISPSDPRPKTVKLGRIERLGRLACRYDDHAWRLDGDDLILVAPSGFETYRMRASTDSPSIDCRRDRAVVLGREQPDVVLRCGGRSSCSEVHRSTSRVHGAAAMFDDGSWIYAASKEGVVAIRREGQGEQLYRLASDFEVVAITVLENKPYLVIDELTRFSLVAIR